MSLAKLLNKYKRKKMKLANADGDLQEVTQETEGGCDPVNSGNAHVEVPESSRNNDESIQQWRLAIEQAIEKTTEVPPVLREVNNRLAILWNDYRERMWKPSVMKLIVLLAHLYMESVIKSAMRT